MSDFLKRKLRTYFQRVDYDKDGAITKNDFEQMAKRFIEDEKLDAAKGKQLHDKLIEIWEKYLKVVAGGKSLKEAEFVEALLKQVKDPALKAALAGPLPLFFSAVDANGDNEIDGKEFALFFEIFGIDPKLAEESFKAIDTNSDGRLSAEEFKDAGIKFFTSEDESCPTKFFWGPLV